MQKSETNTYIRFFGYVVLFGAMIAMAITFFVAEGPSKLLGIVIFVAGAFNALLLFAISEVLTRLQAIELNTRQNKDENGTPK